MPDYNILCDSKKVQAFDNIKYSKVVKYDFSYRCITSYSQMHVVDANLFISTTKKDQTVCFDQWSCVFSINNRKAIRMNGSFRLFQRQSDKETNSCNWYFIQIVRLEQTYVRQIKGIISISFFFIIIYSFGFVFGTTYFILFDCRSSNFHKWHICHKNAQRF